MIDAVTAGALDTGKTGSYDLCLLRGTGHDRHSGSIQRHLLLSGIIADEMAIGMVNQKTTAVRLIPVIGKDVRGNRGVRRPSRTRTDHAGQSSSACDAFVSQKGKDPGFRLFTALKIKRKNKTEGNKWSEIVRFKVIKGE